MQCLALLDINKVAVILVSFLSNLMIVFILYEFLRTPVFLEEENIWLFMTDANYLHHFKLSSGKIGKIVPRK